MKRGGNKSPGSSRKASREKPEPDHHAAEIFALVGENLRHNLLSPTAQPGEWRSDFRPPGEAGRDAAATDAASPPPPQQHLDPDKPTDHLIIRERVREPALEVALERVRAEGNQRESEERNAAGEHARAQTLQREHIEREDEHDRSPLRKRPGEERAHVRDEEHVHLR